MAFEKFIKENFVLILGITLPVFLMIAFMLASTLSNIFYSTHIRSRIVLFTSTFSMLLYIGYFTAQHFANSIGWPISLVLLGAVFIGLSNMALKINQKYIK